MSTDERQQKKLLDLAERYDNKSSKAYMSYQETGTQRYYREYENAEEMANVLRMAANAEQDHRALVFLRSEIANLAVTAKNGDTEQLAKNVIAIAEMYGLIRKE